MVKPEYIKCKPSPDALQAECLSNVRVQVSKYGGEAISGWAIWQWQKVLVEAEHHMVWRSPEGDLMCVTPQRNREKRILFAVDSAATFDESGVNRRDNIRCSLSPKDADIQTLIKCLAQQFQIQSEDCWIEDGKLQCRYDQAEVSTIQQKMKSLVERISERYHSWPS